MKRQTCADLAMSAAILSLGVSMIFSGGSLLRLKWSHGGAAAPLNLSELLAVTAAGSGVALLCWWLLALICAVVSALAQQKGAEKLAHVSATFAPAFMRRVVIAVLGLNLLTAPLAHANEIPAVDPLWHAQTIATAPAITGAGGSGATVISAPETEVVNPQWVPTTTETAPDLLINPQLRDESGVAEANKQTSAPASEAPTKNHSTIDRDDDVVVKGGDSLWSIVTASLGPYASDVEVAQSWPNWYEANRETIGPDPNVILPGQILHAP